MDGQGEPQESMVPGRRLMRWLAPVLLPLLAYGSAAAAAPEVGPRATPSGMPVPRYVALKFDKVNARTGPGADHKLLWVYIARGLPVQVVAETSEWRRVCDPEGGLVWVHKRTTDGRRMVMNRRPTHVALLRKPKADAKIAAYLGGRSLASLMKCEDGWCRIKADGVSGWIHEGELWGTAETAQCR